MSNKKKHQNNKPEEVEKKSNQLKASRRKEIINIRTEYLCTIGFHFYKILENSKYSNSRLVVT